MSKSQLVEWNIELAMAINTEDTQKAHKYQKLIAEYVDEMTKRLLLIRKEANYQIATGESTADEIIKIVDGQSNQLDGFISSDGRVQPYTDPARKRLKGYKPY